MVLWLLAIVVQDGGLPVWEPLESGNSASLRGLSVLNERVAWFGGSGGVWGCTLDGGKSWQGGVVVGANLDFRDVHCVDEQHVLLMGVGPGKQSRIFQTRDGGTRWQLLFTNPWEKGFFDAFSFWDATNGVMLSDPIDDRPFLLKTRNGGKSWKRLPADTFPIQMKEEYGFAASGSCVALSGKNHIWIATGGSQARVFHSDDRGMTWRVTTTPLQSGNASSGIFSIAFRDAQHGVIVGGNYQKEGGTGATAAWSQDSGKTWRLAGNHQEVPFRSSVAPVPGKPGWWVATGPSGSSLSGDDGRTWRSFAGGYHVLAFGTTADSGYAAGRDGRLARLAWPGN